MHGNNSRAGVMPQPFIELADLLKSRWRFGLTVAAFALVQLVLLNRFVHWQWAG